ncbi:rhodanese-like domain-containing protein [soil metagenome]
MNFLKKLLGLGTDQEEVKKALDKGAKIIDVRTPSEFSGGNVKGSINIPLDQIGTNIEKIKAYKTPIVLCCASGMRSGQATTLLKQKGIEAYNAGGWRNLN